MCDMLRARDSYSVSLEENHTDPSFTSFFNQISLRCVRVLVLVCGALHLYLHFVRVLML